MTGGVVGPSAGGARRAWYLHCSPEDVADRAVLVGDPDRARRIAARLGDPVWLNEDRGLVAVTGTWRGRRLTVSAFGMGAPSAAVVLHELRDLGVRVFLRLGTVMCLPPAALGDLILAEAAVRGESTSGTYVPAGYPAAADHALATVLRGRLRTTDRRWLAGLVASYDGFYTELLALEADRAAAVAARRAELERLGVLGTDMETSAVLAVGRALGGRAASLCLATVDGRSAAQLSREDRQTAEEDLITVGLDALVHLDLPDPRRQETMRLEER